MVHLILLFFLRLKMANHDYGIHGVRSPPLCAGNTNEIPGGEGAKIGCRLVVWCVLYLTD